jgi:hypothetical protein
MTRWPIVKTVLGLAFAKLAAVQPATYKHGSDKTLTRKRHMRVNEARPGPVHTPG